MAGHLVVTVGGDQGAKVFEAVELVIRADSLEMVVGNQIGI